MFPEVVDTNCDFGYTHPSLFGVPIKITALVKTIRLNFVFKLKYYYSCWRKFELKIILGILF